MPVSDCGQCGVVPASTTTSVTVSAARAVMAIGMSARR
jgi:hypothetical protein